MTMSCVLRLHVNDVMLLPDLVLLHTCHQREIDHDLTHDFVLGQIIQPRRMRLY
jgi:hypothetical protein